jgi:WD40 repeat protein
MFDAESGKELLTLTGHKETVTAVAFSPDGGRFVTGSDDKTVRLWDAATGDEIRTWKAANAVTSVAFGPDGGRLAAGCANAVVVWEVSK